MCSDARKILCFNSKPGYLAEYDLRKESEPVRVKQLCREEITAVAISPDQRSLVVGQVDGLVKIYNLADVLAGAADVGREGIQEREPAINAFTNYGRRASVTKLRFHPCTGALFASSNVGVVKLLRLAI